jgi:hypothetical protein
VRKVFEKQPLAISSQQSAKSGRLRPSADSLGLGLGLGGPWVAQAWPKGHPSAMQGPRKRRLAEVLCLQQELKNGGPGDRKDPKSHHGR